MIIWLIRHCYNYLKLRFLNVVFIQFPDLGEIIERSFPSTLHYFAGTIKGFRQEHHLDFPAIFETAQNRDIQTPRRELKI